MEVEMKFAIQDVQRIKKKILALGGDRVSKVTNKDHYFSAVHRDFMKTKECLRIREVPETGKVIITYKPSSSKEMLNSNMMWKEELETECSDANIIRKILLAIDCKKLVTVEKIREEFKLFGCTLVLDEVKHVGSFIEIEIISNDVEAAKDQIQEVANKLGLEDKHNVNRNYRDLTIEGMYRYRNLWI